MTPPKPGKLTPESLDEELFHIELSIAKLADALWRGTGFCNGRDLILWLEAEREVLGEYFGFEWPVAPVVDLESLFSP